MSVGGWGVEGIASGREGQPASRLATALLSRSNPRTHPSTSPLVCLSLDDCQAAQRHNVDPLTIPPCYYSSPSLPLFSRTIANQRNIEIDLNRLHWTPYRQEAAKK